MKGMLSGVTVLELGQVIAGTYGGMILADLGAEVIKIEPPWGDAARNPTITPVRGESAIHLQMNRGKKSLVVDLKSEAGREVFYALVARSDVVIDNFRPGVMGRLGIDHDRLRRHNPRIITVSITGFGATGPARNRPAFDLVVQAYSGLLDMTGPADGPPARVGIPIADITGGVFTCLAVLGGLVGRELHGEGQHADISMLDVLVSMLSYDAFDHLNTGARVARRGTAHAHIVPWQALEVKDGFVVVAARGEKFWRNLCDAIGRPELKDDPRTRDNAARLENRSFVEKILTEAFAQRTKDEWMAMMEEYDLPVAPVNDIAEAFADPQVRARGMVQQYRHPSLGEILYPPSPMKWSEWQYPTEPAPMLGEHTAEVLAAKLAYSVETIGDLEDRGVVRTGSGRQGES
ncbi:MAG: CoA transferase [bacterium]|nr:CoA transferase [Acidimicrobiia bacterium]MCY4648990.1 CoA transferase [bacterium]